MRRILPALLLTLAAAIAAEPDTLGWVTGTVTDLSTGRPLFRAMVIAQGTGRGAPADTWGRYLFGIPPGRYRLMASYASAGADTAEVEVSAAETAVVNLQPDLQYRQRLRAESDRQFDSIQAALETTDWDVTVRYYRLYDNRRVLADSALSDSARVRALRVWKADTGRFYAREFTIDSEDGDTVATSYLLVEDGQCTAMLQRYQDVPHRIIKPAGGAIVHRQQQGEGFRYVGWPEHPSSRPGMLLLLLQVEGQTPDDRYYF